MKKKYYILLIAMLMVLTTLFIYKYVKNESPVYIFDYSGYHEIYKGYSQKLVSTPIEFVKEVISSIRNADYNCSPILLIIPFYLIFRTSRMGYILGLGLFYVVPTIILTIILCKNMILKKEEAESEKKYKYAFLAFLCISAFLYTRWWSPTLRGLPDIVAVIPLLIAGILVQKYSFLDKNKIYIPFIVGLLLYIPFMLRRYFVYTIIGFYVALFIIELIEFIKIKENKKEKFISAFKNFAIAGFTTLICVLILQTPLVKTILGENYSNSYSAFQAPLMTHLTNAINEFGYIVLGLAIIGAIYALINKEHRRNSLFCLLNIMICYLTFMTVQAMGVHHYLTISAWIFVLFAYGVYAICSFIKNNIFKIAVLVIVTILMALNFSATYIFRELKVPILTQNNKYYKFYYENFNEIERLISDIDKLVTVENCKFSVLASTETLSDNLMDLLGTDTMKKSIIYTSAIDLRDGVNFNSLMSEYIVVTDIAQVGVSVEGQRVVSVPNDAIMNGTSIGKAYSVVSGPYTIQGGVKAYIYKKDRAFNEEEVNEYMEILKNYHPEWRETYNEFDNAILMAERELGEGIGDVRRYKHETLYFSPGYTPTTYKIKLNKKIKTLDLKLYIDGTINPEDKTAGNVLVTVMGDDEVLYRGEIHNTNSQELQLNLQNYDNLTFIVDKNVYLNCDWLYVDINQVTVNT